MRGVKPLTGVLLSLQSNPSLACLNLVLSPPNHPLHHLRLVDEEEPSLAICSWLLMYAALVRFTWKSDLSCKKYCLDQYSLSEVNSLDPLHTPSPNQTNIIIYFWREFQRVRKSLNLELDTKVHQNKLYQSTEKLFRLGLPYCPSHITKMLIRIVAYSSQTITEWKQALTPSHCPLSYLRKGRGP